MEDILKFKDNHPNLFHHHQKLQEITLNIKRKHNVLLNNNIYTYDGLNTDDICIGKMMNLYYIAKDIIGDILEIGFNSGNSALVFLYANPNCKIYAFDICYNIYEKHCVDYLNTHFNNRVILIKGDSNMTVPYFNDLKKFISIYHIDGGNNDKIISTDIVNCYNMGLDGSFLIINNCSKDYIREKYDNLYHSGKIQYYEPKTRIMHDYHLIGKIVR